MPTRPNYDYSSDELVASAARTTTGSVVWEGFGQPSSLRVQLNITAASGTTPSMTVTVEDSIDGANWNTVDTFPAKTAAGREVRNITSLASPPVLFADMIRVSWTISGTTPSFTFAVHSFSQATGVA